LEEAGLTSYAITAFILQSRMEQLYAAARQNSSLAIKAQMIRAFLFATPTHAFVVLSFRRFSAIQRLLLSVFVLAR